MPPTPPAASPTWSGGSSIHPELFIARTPEQHRANGIDVRTRHEVTAIDTMASTVTVRDLETGRESIEHCDELLIGTGASGIGPPWPGIAAQGVLQLRTLGDAAEQGRRLDAGARRAVVVGAGYIGLEVAEGRSITSAWRFSRRWGSSSPARSWAR